MADCDILDNAIMEMLRESDDGLTVGDIRNRLMADGKDVRRPRINKRLDWLYNTGSVVRIEGANRHKMFIFSIPEASE